MGVIREIPGNDEGQSGHTAGAGDLHSVLEIALATGEGLRHVVRSHGGDVADFRQVVDGDNGFGCTGLLAIDVVHVGQGQGREPKGPFATDRAFDQFGGCRTAQGWRLASQSRMMSESNQSDSERAIFLEAGFGDQGFVIHSGWQGNGTAEGTDH